jgi:hypothetical protein
MEFLVEFVSSEVKPLKIALTLAMLSSDEECDEMEVGWASDSPIFDVSGREYDLNYFLNYLSF